MKILNNEKICRIIAAVCFALNCVCLVINAIFLAHRIDLAVFAAFIAYGIDIIIYALIAVFLLRKLKILPSILGMMYAISCLSGSILNVYDHGQWNVLFGCFSFLLTFVIVLLSISKNNIAKKIWFLGGAAYLPYAIALICNPITFWNGSVSKKIIDIVSCVITFAGLLFVCRWATLWQPNAAKRERKEKAADGAEKLIQYREMLKNGSITQEEYDEFRKNILG